MSLERKEGGVDDGRPRYLALILYSRKVIFVGAER